jgi:hypothetical protein
MAPVFGFLGLMAVWGIDNTLKTGATFSVSGWSFRLDDDPISFPLMSFVMAGFVVFGLAEILFALGVAAIRSRLFRMRCCLWPGISPAGGNPD